MVVTFTLDGIRDLIAGYGALGPLVAVGLYILHSFVPFPAQVLTLAIGAVYGPVWGSLLAWVAAMAGALVAFGVARLGGRPLAQRFVPPAQLTRFDGWVERYGIAALLGVRVMPIIPFNLINYAAGLTQISLWTFLWTTGIGILPITLLGAVAAGQLAEGKTAGVWLMGALVLVSGTLALLKGRRQS